MTIALLTDFAADIEMIIHGNPVSFFDSYSQSPAGEVFCMKGSSGLLELSMKQERAESFYKLSAGSELAFRIRRQ